MCSHFFSHRSYFNMDEVHAVMDYVKELLTMEEKGRKVTQADIGVVVPYKLQSKIIKRVCNQLNFDEITVGTPEAFQGQEKSILIVTTVRTDGNLGFLDESQVSMFKSVKIYPIINHCIF